MPLAGTVGKEGGITDHTGPAGPGGTGLIGLREGLAAAGGSLAAGSRGRGGVAVTVELPPDAAEERPAGAGRFRSDADVYVDRWSAPPPVEGVGNGWENWSTWDASPSSPRRTSGTATRAC
ncbi:hypothetical protein CEB94_12455 [Streptomyces hawaiiensis]|uniref:Signal transduction histidine kinase subgroup 3 dimerisation and phosphoacceptor domain-containing protein n=1 Tax=Streptomyces hawaiiensis TaxID=67305 RepID=A0A6G5RBZ7_9ACTN|nr:hypothetical protein CEB94_12455 [Streptomyces hawaiiensis]